MARPKSYNKEKALESACMAFWEHGYDALGVRAIAEITGLNQFAIRTEFGGKEGLFIEALRFYIKCTEQTMLLPVKQRGIASIVRFFEALVTPTSPISSVWGCLIVNIGVENATLKSSKIEKISKKYWHTLEAHFLQALQFSIDNGELSPKRDASEMSKILIIAVMGIHITNRTNKSCEAGAPMVEMIKTQLEDWKN